MNYFSTNNKNDIFLKNRVEFNFIIFLHKAKKILREENVIQTNGYKHKYSHMGGKILKLTSIFLFCWIDKKK